MPICLASWLDRQEYNNIECVHILLDPFQGSREEEKGGRMGGDTLLVNTNSVDIDPRASRGSRVNTRRATTLFSLSLSVRIRRECLSRHDPCAYLPSGADERKRLNLPCSPRYISLPSSLTLTFGTANKQDTTCPDSRPTKTTSRLQPSCLPPALHPPLQKQLVLYWGLPWPAMPTLCTRECVRASVSCRVVSVAPHLSTRPPLFPDGVWCNPLQRA